MLRSELHTWVDLIKHSRYRVLSHQVVCPWGGTHLLGKLTWQGCHFHSVIGKYGMRGLILGAHCSFLSWPHWTCTWWCTSSCTCCYLCYWCYYACSKTTKIAWHFESRLLSHERGGHFRINLLRRICCTKTTKIAWHFECGLLSHERRGDFLINLLRCVRCCWLDLGRYFCLVRVCHRWLNLGSGLRCVRVRRRWLNLGSGLHRVGYRCINLGGVVCRRISYRFRWPISRELWGDDLCKFKL